MNFQDMIAALTRFWADQGCVVHQGYDLEVGAGTFNPATFLRCLGPEPYSAVYVEPSRRPKDGRYGENPNRSQFYFQMQVIMKPSPANIQDLYLQSLKSIGLNLDEHDIRFVHDDWENPTIGAWGLGWEIWLDGMEVTQFTYFQAIGGLSVKPVSAEITYGLERLAMYLQGVDSMFDLKWNDTIFYGDMYKRSEWEWSHHNFNEADTSMWLRHFDDFEDEAKRLIERNLPIPAYDFVMKASHAFNILDARGVISVTERTGYIARIRALAKLLAESYLKSREEQAFPLLRNSKPHPEPKTPSPVSSKWSPEEKADFLLEIGSEELPATFVPIGLGHLEKEMRHFLDKYSISYSSIRPYGTPRRLALLVKDLRGGTASQTVEKKGPSVDAAFEADGTLSKAGNGFFRSIGLPALSLQHIRKGNDKVGIKSIQGVDYLFATVHTAGQSTRELLAKNLSEVILKMDFPKKMRWGALDIEYARPLRWIVSLYGSEEIPFSIGDITSGRTTYGHRQIAPKEISLTHAGEYLEKLRQGHVMADIEERKKTIQEGLKTIEKQLNGQAIAQERVMPQVLQLIEWPFLTAAAFNPSFLEAPKEVLISEMVEHQKYFPVANHQGTLLPSFIVVCNNAPTPMIRHGNEKALAPRLADGLFLYREDLKIPLEKFNAKLKAITFQKDLGSVWAKVERLTEYMKVLHGVLPICPLQKALRAAHISKADLASELVGEFPELQGIIGRIYALHAHEDPDVADAIDEQWMPKGEKSSLPKGAPGVLLSLGEKIDNFLSCFCLEMQPTSSSDPYALRRQAIGLIKIVIQKELHLPLDVVLNLCFDKFVANPELTGHTKQKFLNRKSTVIQEILEFVTSRLRPVFSELGFGKDEIEAILSKDLHDIYDSYRLLTALHAFRIQKHDQFLTTLEVYTRSKKILLSQNPGLTKKHISERPAVNETLLSHSTERALFDKIQKTKKQFDLSFADKRNIEKRNYEAAFGILSEMGGPVAAFFDAVKVLDENPALKTNRLALLQETWELCEQLADFSKIQEHV